MTTRLESDNDQIHAFQNPRFYGKFYGTQLSTGSNVYDADDSSRQVRPLGEDASLTYSGTDTTHTYESIRGSVHSTGSFRFSDAFPKYLIESPVTRSKDFVDDDDVPQENVPLQSQFYSVQRQGDAGGGGSVVSYPRSQCSCPRCSQINVYPVQTSQCRCGRCSQLSMYQSGGTGYGSDGYTDYGIYNRSLVTSRPASGFNGAQTLDRRRRKRHNSESGYAEDEIIYMDDNSQQGNLQENPVFLPSKSAFYPVAGGQKCNCRRCSQNKLAMSDDERGSFYETPRTNQSEFYGVPGPSYPVQYADDKRFQRCNCKRCSQNSINLIENFVVVRDNAVSFNPKSDRNEQPDLMVNSSTEHRKRKRNKLHRPVSLNTSSDDANTGSEKSFRSGVPKTNGSLLTSKFVSR